MFLGGNKFKGLTGLAAVLMMAGSICSINGMESADFFRLIYTVLINKEKGPKLAGFLKACGSETILPILKRY